MKNNLIVNCVSALVLSLLWLSPHLTKAQFEGKIIYQRTNVDPKTKQEKVIGEMELILTPDHIVLKGVDNIARMKLVGSEPTNSIIVRQQEQDFLMMNGQSSALKVSKRELQSMSSLLGNMGGTSKGSNQLSMRSTDVTDELNGYAIRKFVLWNKEKPLRHIDIWFTEDLDVNWGMLSEKWLAESGSMFIPSFVFENFFKKNSVPLLIQEYENDTLKSEVKSARIVESKIPARQTAVPEGLSVMSFQQYMMLKMSGN